MALAFLEPADVVLLTVRDLNAASAWYQEKLGCRPVSFEEDTVVFEFEPGQPNLVIGLPAPGTESDCRPVVPVFYAKNLKKAHEILSQRAVLAGPIQQDRGGNPFFECQDPDGNAFEICQAP